MTNDVNKEMLGCKPLQLLLNFIRYEMSHLEGVLEYCDAFLYTINLAAPTVTIELNQTKVSAAPHGEILEIWNIVLHFMMTLGVMWFFGGFNYE